MTEEFKAADINGDGVISPEEFQLELKREREKIHQQQRRRDMMWYALAAVVVVLAGWAMWGMIATAIDWKANGIK